MRSALSEALSEIRNISSGLSLPQLSTMSLGEAIALAVGMHQEHTGTKVHTAIDELPTDVPLPLKICAYRFVQEGLANAYRHAGAIDQRVAARSGRCLEISVSDKGPGFAPGGGISEGLGLTGMRARIEALGGTLSIVSEPGCGTRLTAQFDLEVLQSKGGRHGTEG
jgi:signal transduction histidine kinase